MSPKPPAAVGMAFADVDTPALVIDLDAFERNLKRMADFVGKSGVRLRAHAKTHKYTIIAAKQGWNVGAGGASAARKCRKPRCWWRAASATCWSPTKSPARASSLVSPPWRAAPSIAVCVDDFGNVAEMEAAAAKGGVTLDVLGGDRCRLRSVAASRPVCRPRVSPSRSPGSPHLTFASHQAYQGSAQHVRKADTRPRPGLPVRGGDGVEGNAACLCARPGRRGAHRRWRRHGHLRGSRQPAAFTNEAAVWVLHFHGRRLRAQQARRRRSVRRLRARPVHLRDGDEHARTGTRAWLSMPA